jgi:hypothetical protein
MGAISTSMRQMSHSKYTRSKQTNKQTSKFKQVVLALLRLLTQLVLFMLASGSAAKQTNKQTNKQTGRQACRQAGRPAGRQAGRHAGSQAVHVALREIQHMSQPAFNIFSPSFRGAAGHDSRASMGSMHAARTRSRNRDNANVDLVYKHVSFKQIWCINGLQCVSFINK